MKKKYKIKFYPGEKALQGGSAIGGAAIASTGSAIAWYSSAGFLTKVALTVGLVNPPVAMFAVAGAGGALLASSFTYSQLVKKDRAEAEKILDS